ncbi:hypothetical protein [Clostridium rectalis]|uniref:hypothetical protein n=1 Tax=Clostridium rectalis TaxID=2040295 RepID=UPI000F632C60|nr:hypothetical protein [Clostridium rectalis]
MIYLHLDLKEGTIIFSTTQIINYLLNKPHKGDKVFTDTIDQILSYMCWRDTKGAILIFNRNKNLSNIIKKIPDLSQKHPNYKKEINIQQETWFRYIFTQPNDNNREILLTIMVFDIPVEKKVIEINVKFYNN